MENRFSSQNMDSNKITSTCVIKETRCMRSGTRIKKLQTQSKSQCNRERNCLKI